LDPFGLHDDARLWDALRRSYLVETTKSGTTDVAEEGTPTPEARFTLDSVIEEEGGNLSLGQVSTITWTLMIYLRTSVQRSMVSLARALIKDAKILILDEATGARRPDFAMNPY
jgi:ABC-type multidrug transport system fused ATPase/permease subunit